MPKKLISLALTNVIEKSQTKRQMKKLQQKQNYKINLQRKRKRKRANLKFLITYKSIIKIG
ncbi:MAG: hypothetical protein DBY43_06535 [Clostridiaceae bacterium]|nr:MAG: hypothetical protein DBY43_06535 [Clostridiaceae bacterium]